MNLVVFIASICLAFVILVLIIFIQDEQRIRTEEDLRRCTETDCYFNEDLICRSLSETWNPELLDNCPDYTED